MKSYRESVVSGIFVEGRRWSTGGYGQRANSEAHSSEAETLTREEDEEWTRRTALRNQTLIPFSQLKQCLTLKKTNYENMLDLNPFFLPEPKRIHYAPPLFCFLIRPFRTIWPILLFSFHFVLIFINQI